VRREDALPLGRERGPFGAVFEQLGDPEVQQLDVAVDADEDVARLDVAMDHQVAVGMRDRAEDVVEQFEALIDVEPMRVAVEIDRQARDEIEHEVRLPPGGHAGIEQARDVRVGQPRQDGALALEPRPGGMADERQVQELDGDEAADALVGAARAPYAAAASLAEQRLDDVGADRRAFERRCGRRQGASRGDRRRIEEVLFVGAGFPADQGVERVGQRGVLRSQRRDARRAIGRIQIEHLVEQGAQPPPRRRVDRFHGGANPRPLALGSPVGGGA